MAMRRSTRSPEPQCWWCGESIPTETGFRGTDPQFGEFQGTVRVVVCAPSCPSKPEASVVTSLPTWRWRDDMLELAVTNG